MNSTAALFLDRDGVINVDKQYVHRIEDFEFVDGTFAALRSASQTGLQLFVITNQSAIGRGYCTEGDFQVLSRWMRERLEEERVSISAIYHCPHRPEARCHCRKPAPGMMLRAAKEHGIDLAQSWMIGDQETDIEAALNAGIAHTVRLTNGEPGATQARYVFGSLTDAARRIQKVRAEGAAAHRRMPARN